VPDVELRVGTALERLTGAREQLREYLEEIHNYTRSCQEDLENLQGAVQADAERLDQQAQQLRRGQDEHRLAVAGFRQQLINWQGQLTDKKRLLTRDETRLERRQAVVDEQAREIDATSQQLAKQAEQLKQQEKHVAERRQVMDEHLTDMREWYRRKLRDLAGIKDHAEDADHWHEGGEAEEIAPGMHAPHILSLTGPADSADHKLGDLLKGLGLVDGYTLTSLLVQS